MTATEKNEIYTLLNALREQVITQEQFDRLDYLISENPDMAREYLDFVKLWTYLQFFQVASHQDDTITDLTQEEAEAIASELEKELSQSCPAEASFDDSGDFSVNRTSVFRKVWVSSIVSLAASLLVVVSIYFYSMMSRIEVATVSDMVSAQWVGRNSPDIGERLSIGKSLYKLRYGFVELAFDNNARVTIEGPAEFYIAGEDRIKCNYGSVFSNVPKEAIGFAIATPKALIIDLGTQFGVQIDKQGDTELHVLKGKTALVAGEGEQKASGEVTQGQARKVSGTDEQVSEIPFDSKLFARDIDSSANMIWRGRSVINLADIVGGGNGWGTGELELGIDAVTGKRLVFGSEDRKSNGDYVKVDDPFIDGVFVPQGKDRYQVISSNGHIFYECPKTNGIYYSNIVNGYGRDLVDYKWRAPHGELGNRFYGTAEYPALFMHANLGITYDLDAIRRSLPDGKIAKFTADAGLSSDNPRQGNFDIWILVDGELRFSRKGINDIRDIVSIEIPLRDSDRFLTLVSTDGGDPGFEDGRTLRSTDSDWCVFARPSLELSLADNPVE
ncbi:MAG: NPCBM/NEW2 domain-containing protein [Sedimentisphaerales bacterium]|nr:NPCBM/NEW2 domain-containing protein [Sedimentisphaerales bacterium]MBN2843650.1 NPCBM/NEW2 domain-containing protein [Sedimentisphaerales bacterium]